MIHHLAFRILRGHTSAAWPFSPNQLVKSVTKHSMGMPGSILITWSILLAKMHPYLSTGVGKHPNAKER